jgi:hypothetical protein
MKLSKITNDILINPEDNLELSNYISELLKDFTVNIPMRRDNCGPINWELYKHLVNKGLDKNKLKMTFGEFKTDNLNLINMRDLTKEERRLYKNLYSDKFTNEMIIEFIKDQMPDSLDDFHYLPHQWLEYDGIILDAASRMFNKGLIKPISKENYIKR